MKDDFTIKNCNNTKYRIANLTCNNKNKELSVTVAQILLSSEN